MDIQHRQFYSTTIENSYTQKINKQIDLAISLVNSEKVATR